MMTRTARQAEEIPVAAKQDNSSSLLRQHLIGGSESSAPISIFASMGDAPGLVLQHHANIFLAEGAEASRPRRRELRESGLISGLLLLPSLFLFVILEEDLHVLFAS